MRGLLRLERGRRSKGWLVPLDSCQIFMRSHCARLLQTANSRNISVQRAQFKQPFNLCGRRYLHPFGPIAPLGVPTGKFDIVFWGRDGFSCDVFRELQKSGMYCLV